jgi:hypothetical protein
METGLGYRDVAKEPVVGLIGRVTDHASGELNPQTVTIGGSTDRVRQFWGDPEDRSKVLGDIADVSVTADRLYLWQFRHGPAADVGWRLGGGSDVR